MGCHCTTRGASRARQLIPLTATELPWTWGSKICDELLRKGLRRVEPLFSGDVLDLGCGAMPYRSVLGARAQRWIGLDRPIAAAGRPAADVFGAATALPFKKECFDVVLCTQVLEHIPTPLALFEQAHEVLRPGGFLVLTTPQTNPLHEEPNDYFRFTIYGLKFLAVQTRFHVIQAHPLGGAIATLGQMLVWHLGWMERFPVLGRPMAAAARASASWLALQLDPLSHRYGGGAEKDTINWLLVAQKLV